MTHFGVMRQYHIPDATRMVEIGSIPDAHKDDLNFTPSSTSIPLLDAFVTGVSDAGVGYRASVNEHVGDAVFTTDERLIWKAGVNTGQVLTINKGELQVSQGMNTFSHVCLARNGRTSTNLRTLEDLWQFKTYTVQILPTGARLTLMDGDVLILKPYRSRFHTITKAGMAPQDLVIGDEWQMFLCISEFTFPEDVILSTLRQPGVLRDLRERIEMFLGCYEVSWDPYMLATSGSNIVCKVNPAKTAAYEAHTSPSIKKFAGQVYFPGVEPDEVDTHDANGRVSLDSTDDEGGDLSEFSSLDVSNNKRKALEEDDAVAGKKPKV